MKIIGKPSRIHDQYDLKDFEQAKETAETLVHLFNSRKEATHNTESDKNDYAGFWLDNNLYGQNALNAAIALGTFAEVIMNCDKLPLQARNEALDYCINNLNRIHTNCLKFVKRQLNKDSISYRTANISEALAITNKTLLQANKYRRHLPKSNP